MEKKLWKCFECGGETEPPCILKADGADVHIKPMSCPFDANKTETAKWEEADAA